MTEFGFARSEQLLATPFHLALIHYGEASMREAMVDFLSPALDDPTQAIYLCGPPGGASRLLSYLEQDTGRDLHEEVNKKRIVLGQGDRDADQQLQNLLDPVRDLCGRGFAVVRVVGPAAWDVDGYSAPEDFLWYESRILPGIEGIPVRDHVHHTTRPNCPRRRFSMAPSKRTRTPDHGSPLRKPRSYPLSAT